MTRRQVISFLVITTFALIEQNNFTKMNSNSSNSNEDQTEGFFENECLWPPMPLWTYVNQNSWTRSNNHFCKLGEHIHVPSRTAAGSANKEIKIEITPVLDAKVTSTTESDILFNVLEMEGDQGSGHVHLPTEPPPAEQRSEEEMSRPTSSPSDDTIPSFSEWTKLQLAQRKESNVNNINKNKTTQQQEGKNFASTVCGAKIRNNNPEAQNPSGVISSSNDEYMLNRCTSKIWFILELCEPVQVEKVGFGNLELFASNPDEVDLEISVRYPSREWTLLGTFHLSDIRNVHSLILPSSSNTTFGKFLRVTIKSHHGSEHYCPLSLIKVFGKSEYEVLDPDSSPGIDEQVRGEEESSSLYEEGLASDDQPASRSVLGAAKDVVIDIVKKAVNVLGNGNKSATSEDATSFQTNFTSMCSSLIQCVENSSVRDSVLKTLSCEPHKLLWLMKASQWCGWEHCHEFFRSYCLGGASTREGLYSAIYGQSVVESMCNFLYPLKSCNVHPVVGKDSPTTKDQDQLLQSANGVPNVTLEPVILGGDVNQQQKDISPVTEELHKEIVSHIIKEIQENDPTQVISSSTPSNRPDDPQKIQFGQASLDESSQQSISTSSDSAKTVQTPESQLPSSPPVIIVEQPAGNGFQLSTSVPLPDEQSPTSSQQNKESAFVRLSNRIRVLEMNQSLSSGYLEELSRRFKKQSEDINHSHELFRTFLSETMRRTKLLEDSFRYEIRKLNRNIENLREVIYKVEVQRSGLVIFCLIQVICTLAVFWKQSTHKCCSCNASSPRTGEASSTNQHQANTPPNPRSMSHDLMFRKRSNSEQLKKISKKKKRKELVGRPNHPTNADGFSFNAPVILDTATNKAKMNGTVLFVSPLSSSSTANSKSQNTSNENGNGSKNGSKNGSGSKPGSNPQKESQNSKPNESTTADRSVGSNGTGNGNNSSNSSSSNSLHSNKSKPKVKSILFWK